MFSPLDFRYSPENHWNENSGLVQMIFRISIKWCLGSSRAANLEILWSGGVSSQWNGGDSTFFGVFLGWILVREESEILIDLFFSFVSSPFNKSLYLKKKVFFSMIHAACLTTFISDSTVFRFPTRSDAQRPRTHSAPVSVAKDDAQSCWGAEAEGALEIWHNTLQRKHIPPVKKGKSSTQKCLFIGDMSVATRGFDSIYDSNGKLEEKEEVRGTL